MTLEEWDSAVKPHLQKIECGAELAARHARELPVKPNFASNAQHELQQARQTLEKALADIVAAELAYEAKPLENSHAA
jgi:hypothetical protein